MITTLKIIPDLDSNSLTFSKNYRIFTTSDPVVGIDRITDIIDDVTTEAGGPDLSLLVRKFRYSTNKIDWSLWYEFKPASIDPNGLNDIKDLIFDKCDKIYFEFKYEYDDGTCLELTKPIIINEIKVRLNSTNDLPTVITPYTFCSDEKCPAIIFNKESSFRPYQVDSAIGIFKELSYHTNQTFGHEVIYFRTVPDSDSGDYIFKEWTIYKNVDRKCVKVLVPNNKFPSNMPTFAEFGIDFERPFEVHIDMNYFQSVFGRGAEPRKRDFLYFPLINRMFEIQGSYLHRGFMMEPVYWRVQLVKFNPNIDMLMSDENRKFLDNIVNSSEELFKEEIENDIKDTTMPSQYNTITTRADASRSAIHPDIKLRPINFTFNYASLMENYYDLSGITSEISSYKITNDNPVVDTTIELVSVQCDETNDHNIHTVIRAYENSDLFKAWLNKALNDNDLIVSGTNTSYVKIKGPYDTIPDHVGQSDRYIQIEAYDDMSFKKQVDVLTDPSDNTIVNFKVRTNAIIYKNNPVFDTDDNSNLSYTCLFNVPSDGSSMNFIHGYDNNSSSGLSINGQYTPSSPGSSSGTLEIIVTVNSDIYTQTIPVFDTNKWHAMIVSMSNTFKQIGMYVYEIIEDVADMNNHIGFNTLLNSISSFNVNEYVLPDDKYSILSSNIKISNIRMFNTMLKENEHDFILSQMYIKDESMLLLIDNVRPQLNVPYISKNK